DGQLHLGSDLGQIPITVTGCAELSGSLTFDVSYNATRGSYSETVPIIESKSGCLKGSFSEVQAVVVPSTCHTTTLDTIGNRLVAIVNFGGIECVSTASIVGVWTHFGAQVGLSLLVMVTVW